MFDATPDVNTFPRVTPMSREIVKLALHKTRYPWLWCHGVTASTWRGKEVNATDAEARRFCYDGALVVAMQELGASFSDYQGALLIIGRGLVSDNDSRGYFFTRRRIQQALKASY